MTYTDIENRIVADLNRSDLTASIVGWVNDVYRELLGRRTWSWMTATTETNTVTNEYRYELPADFGEIKTLVVVDGTNAESIPYIVVDEFDKRHPMVETDTPNVPEEFTVRHGINPSGIHYDEINTYPRAKDASLVLRMYYGLRSTDLSGALVPLMPLQYHSALVFGGLEMGFARLREYDAAGFWMKKKELIYAAMVEDDTKYPSQGVMRPFNAAPALPSDYWNRYTVKSI
jgi:hypothetical protein